MTVYTYSSNKKKDNWKHWSNYLLKFWLTNNCQVQSPSCIFLLLLQSCHCIVYVSPINARQMKSLKVHPNNSFTLSLKMTTTKAHLIILEYNYKFGEGDSLIFSRPKDGNYAYCCWHTPHLQRGHLPEDQLRAHPQDILVKEWSAERVHYSFLSCGFPFCSPPHGVKSCLMSNILF